MVMVVHRGSLVDQQARSFKFCRHIGELKLDSLELGKGASELAPISAVGESFFQCSPRETNGSRAHGAS